MSKYVTVQLLAVCLRDVRGKWVVGEIYVLITKKPRTYNKWFDNRFSNAVTLSAINTIVNCRGGSINDPARLK